MRRVEIMVLKNGYVVSEFDPSRMSQHQDAYAFESLGAMFEFLDDKLETPDEHKPAVQPELPMVGGAHD